jgi:hypothetical protein
MARKRRKMNKNNTMLMRIRFKLDALEVEIAGAEVNAHHACGVQQDTSLMGTCLCLPEKIHLLNRRNFY